MIKYLFVSLVICISLLHAQAQLSYEYIVIGGGSTGSPLASKLARAGYNTTIIEAGPKLSQLILPNLVTNLDNHKWVQFEPVAEVTYVSTPQRRQLTNGTVYFESENMRRYKGDGGCNRHNGGWARYGVNAVYDTWPRGWRSKDLEPYLSEAFLKLKSGIPTEELALQDKIMAEFKEATNYKIVEDWELLRGTELGIQKSLFNYIERNDSYYERYSSFDAYVEKSNDLGKTLHVLSNTVVERLLFDVTEKRGAQRVRDRCIRKGRDDCHFPTAETHDIDTKGVEVTDKLTATKYNITATKEVTVSGGTWDDVTLFMRSGVGDCRRLRVLNITCVLHVPRLGSKFYYHMVLATLMTVNQSHAVIGPNSQFQTQVGVAISTQGQRYPDASIDFHMETNPIFLPSPPLPTPVAFGILLSLRDFGPGTITLDPTDRHKPLIDLKLFQNNWEIPHLMTIFKEYRRLLASSSVYTAEINPGLPLDTDNKLRDYVVQNVEDGAHPVGSIPIGELLDLELRFKGIDNLRVADLSVMPSGNNANPNMFAVALGLKAADLILKDC